MIIITEQVYETTRENISNRLITIITIIKKNILKYEKNFSNINGLNLYISFSILLPAQDKATFFIFTCGCKSR